MDQHGPVVGRRGRTRLGLGDAILFVLVLVRCVTLDKYVPIFLPQLPPLIK